MLRSAIYRTALVTVAATALAICDASAQSWGPRNLDELKAETMRRARIGAHPIRGVKFEDAERAINALHSLDRDHWASVWSDIGEEYMNKAQRAEMPKAARENYYFAWRYFNIGRWPTEKHSPGKRRAYERGLEAFALYGALLSPPIETIHVPFEDSELVMYLRIPVGIDRPPLVLGINGLDTRKEDVMVVADGHVRNGLAAAAIDMPGTGQAPLLIDVGSERMLSAALDYFETRSDIDSSRVVVQGHSWSGYWAAVLAYTERDRLRGAVVHGIGSHGYFQPEWQQKAIMSPEYLFDLFPARSVVYGVDNMKDFLAYGPRLSLVERGFIDRPSAPMLLINGLNDTQQPISDLYLLMEHGDPKTAWINPQGGHMGNSETYSRDWITENVVQPWIMQRVTAPFPEG